MVSVATLPRLLWTGMLADGCGEDAGVLVEVDATRKHGISPGTGPGACCVCAMPAGLAGYWLATEAQSAGGPAGY